MEWIKSLWPSVRGWFIENGASILINLLLLSISILLFRILMGRSKAFLIRREQSKKYDETTKEEQIKRIETLMSIVRQLGKLILVIIFGMMILDDLGVNLGPILASAGIVGLAIGFGAQELVRDFISGFFILIENQIRTGDVAIINGKGGLVEKIELRTITLRDFSGVVHIFQNGKIDSLSNMTKEWSAMVMDIGVGYDADLDQIMGIMLEVGNEMQKDEVFGEKMVEPVEVLGVDEFADSAVIIKVRLITKPVAQWVTSREYRKRLKQAFDKAGIEIPFPQRTISWAKDSAPFTKEGH
jgi:small conductance mechanosensitive channel